MLRTGCRLAGCVGSLRGGRLHWDDFHFLAKLQFEMIAQELIVPAEYVMNALDDDAVGKATRLGSLVEDGELFLHVVAEWAIGRDDEMGFLRGSLGVLRRLSGLVGFTGQEDGKG